MTAKVQPGQSEEAVGVTPTESADAHGVSRRTILRVGAVAGAGVAVATAKGLGGFASADSAFALTSVALGDGLFYIENFPTSPLILAPFTDPLPIPKALAPIPRSVYSTWANPPGPGVASRTRCATSSTRSGRAGSLRSGTGPVALRTRSSTRST